MLKIVRICLAALVLNASGCVDHQLRPVSPLTLHLKSTVEDNFVKTTTSYDYDEKNRQNSVTIGSYYKATIVYNAQNQYERIDRLSNNALSRSYFTYQSSPQGGQVITVKTYSINQQNGEESLYWTLTYSLDSKNHIIESAYPITNVLNSSAKYYYTGENITKVDVKTSPTTTVVYTYDYDDKPNPFYGLVNAESESNAIDRGIINRYSRNNVVKRYTDGIPGATEYYQYDAQGLPAFINSAYAGRFSLNYEVYK